jgi:hypothetical protein
MLDGTVQSFTRLHQRATVSLREWLLLGATTGAAAWSLSEESHGKDMITASDEKRSDKSNERQRMMEASKKKQLGGLPPRYGFMLNPYPDQQVWRCPLCERKIGQRKVPLLIHVDPLHLIALNYTCRFCRACNLLIGKKHDIEHLLTELFRRSDPSVIGNAYLILGTVEKRTWREGVTQPKGIADLLPQASDFATYYHDLRVTRPGYYRVDQEPPIMEPPESQKWVKDKPGLLRRWTERIRGHGERPKRE